MPIRPGAAGWARRGGAASGSARWAGRRRRPWSASGSGSRGARGQDQRRGPARAARAGAREQSSLASSHDGHDRTGLSANQRRPGPRAACRRSRSRRPAERARPAAGSARTRLRRTTRAAADRVVVEPPGQLDPLARRGQLVQQLAPGRVGVQCRRQPGSANAACSARVRLLSATSRSAVVGVAGTRARRPRAAGSSPGRAARRPRAASDTEARRTSWASSALRAPSTRPCSRSSRVALKERYHAERPATAASDDHRPGALMPRAYGRISGAAGPASPASSSTTAPDPAATVS